MLQSLANKHPDVTFINAQGTLAPVPRVVAQRTASGESRVQRVRRYFSRPIEASVSGKGSVAQRRDRPLDVLYGPGESDGGSNLRTPGRSDNSGNRLRWPDP